MRFFPLIVCALLLQVPAKADKFWLTDPDAQKNASAGSSPNVIEGVLVAESDEGYHVRVVGGELILAKKSVWKIEKDDLSVDAIQKAEAAASKLQQAADQERQAAQAAARQARTKKVMDASARRGDGPAAKPAAAEPAPQFDPVIDVLPDARGLSDRELMRETQLAFNLTKDRRYLTLLRQLRRLR